jgi:DNA-binding CsgD family transcriptional regulator
MALTEDARFQRALIELYESANLSTVAQRILAATELLVPSDIYAVTEVDCRNGGITVGGVVRPDDNFRLAFSTAENSFAVLARHAHEHPLDMTNFKKGFEPAAKISDRMTTPAFHNTGLYVEFYRKLRVEDQLVLKVSTAAGRGTGIALSRGSRSFTDVHRQRLNRLAPHVIQAYRNAKRVTVLERANAAPQESVLAVLEELGVGRRESEVLLAIAGGLTNKSAAAMLGVSPLTVKKHLENVYTKLGVENRSAAIARLLRALGIEITTASPQDLAS